MKNQVLRNSQNQAETLAEMGDRLHQFRQQQGLSLEQIAAKTLIPVRTLTAIEQGNLERLPEPIYIQGFLRRYADALGLNGSEFAVAFPTLVYPLPTRSLWNLSVRAQLRPLHLYLVYMALVAGAVSGLSNLLSRSTAPIVSAASPVAQPIRSLTTVPAAPQPATGKQPLGPLNLPKPTAPATETPAALTQPSQSGKPVRVGLKLTDQSWVRVVADGKTEFEGVLPEGSQRAWAATKEVVVRAGNAGGVMVSFNEGKAKPMGQPGSVEEVTFGTKVESATRSETATRATLTALSTTDY